MRPGLSFEGELSMKYLTLLLVTAIAALVSVQQAHAQGFDSVRSAGGKNSSQGKISEISAEGIVLVKGAGGVKETVPANTIYMVVFTGEPAGLSRARINALNGNFTNAQDELAKVDASEVNRPEVKVDIDYYKAFCAAQLALGGAGPLPAAETALLNFVKANRNSYHYYEACEVLGDLAVAQKNYTAAARYYGPLESSSFADIKMRADVRLGRALQAQGKYAEAVAKFDSVLNARASGEEAEKQVLAATLGKAVSLAATDKIDEAIKLVNQVIEKASPEEIELNARANNALGGCYMKAGKNKEALRSFLKVDLIYNGLPEAHAEALANLVKLWTAVGKEDRAQEALALLKERYPESSWARGTGS
jgi:tetratricopeptide (TPR) repeat protein